jgi:hypothetical protein
MMKKISFLLFCSYCLCAGSASAQKEQFPSMIDGGKIVIPRDSAKAPVTTAPTIAPAKKPFSTKKAVLLSTFLPGAGQIYNKRYWEAPLAWAAVGIPMGLIFYNNSWYKKTRNAFDIKFAAQTAGTSPDLSQIDPVLRNLDVNSLQNYRNEFRRLRDLSVLWTIILWGVQVADAAVFAHLKAFDVSPDLSLQFQPIPAAGGQGLGIAVSLVAKPRRMLTFQ